MSEAKTFWLVDSSDPHALSAVLKLAAASANNQVVPLTGLEYAAWTAGKIQSVKVE